MHVGSIPLQGGFHPDIAAVPAAAASALSTAGYIEDNLDGLFTAFIRPDYAQHRAQYMERLRLIYSEGTGRALIERLRLIGEENRIYPILDSVSPPAADAGEGLPASQGSQARHVHPAIQIDNGRVIWDPLRLPLDPRSPDYASQYMQVESCLLELRRHLERGGAIAGGADTAHTASGSTDGYGVPADPAATAALAPADVSASASISAESVAPKPERPAGLNAARPYHLPIWKGKTRLQDPCGNLRIHVSKGLAPHNDELRAILGKIFRTAPGQTLFTELGMCARRGAALIVAEGNGRSGLTTTKNGDVVWMFDRQDLARRCIQQGIATPDQAVYSAFVDLIAACDALGSKLRPDSRWIPSVWQDRRTIVDQFYQCIKAPSEQQLDGVARVRAPGGANDPQGLGRMGHPAGPDSAVHPPDPAPTVSTASTVSTDNESVSPHAARTGYETRPATGGAQASSRGDAPGWRRRHGIRDSLTGIVRSLQTRLGLRNTPRDPMEDTRAYDALIGAPRHYPGQNPYTVISKQ
ncbi:hypothetical protein AKI39_21775 [Bordetella sp. H567]|uniref:hypothetical protein n=1 Tax=Bordetella sp. H567 TaxID=1697043 RepID=UPI00081CFA75|nr:hypothetical protein [Bordetella sp. H567]AOB32803.1 hypothetical protein AKI39_21775 [Bordetella sp. H567]